MVDIYISLYIYIYIYNILYIYIIIYFVQLHQVTTNTVHLQTEVHQVLSEGFA